MTSRRSFLKVAGVGVTALPFAASARLEPAAPLEEFGYGDVHLATGPAQQQFEQTQAVLIQLNEDGLLKPWRIRAGLPAPGPELGGWYDEVPLEKTESGGHGFAPGHCFGQWISALSRGYAVTRDSRVRARLQRLLDLYDQSISGRFYANFRFPAYTYDKMVVGLIDAHKWAGLDPDWRILHWTTGAAEPHLPPKALDRDEPQRRWRKSIGENTANDYTWDESYTLPENLFTASERGAGNRYRQLASRFLLNRTYFDPLSRNENILANHHAYSYCNALSSAMAAYLATGSVKHLRAASNGFNMIASTQSFATGGWGPDESFSAPRSGALFRSLTGTHRSFETPCGSYAHTKLTRYLLRITQDGRYGDSLERVVYNTVLGAQPLQPDGRAFYYSDYHSCGAKTYFPDRWPCCSGTLPQVAADYRILTYFHDPQGIWVNLYLPSAVRWTAPDGAQITLAQAGNYPFEGSVRFTFRASRSSDFLLRLRIPAFASVSPPRLRVNGSPVSAAVHTGFATVRRVWNDGDVLDLQLPLPLRLEPIDPDHPETVALVRGPLVLFPLSSEPVSATREQLLAATASPGDLSWRIASGSGPLTLRPFLAIGREPYATYFRVTAA